MTISAPNTQWSLLHFRGTAAFLLQWGSTSKWRPQSAARAITCCLLLCVPSEPKCAAQILHLEHTHICSSPGPSCASPSHLQKMKDEESCEGRE